MEQTFKLLKGEILFDENKIVIKDDAKKQRWILTLILCLGTFYGAMTFLKYYKTGEKFDFWYGLILSLLDISILTLWLLRSVKSEISLIEVKSIKLNQRFSNKFLDTRLKNNKLRRVIRVDNSEELDKYIEKNIRTILNYGC